MPSKSLQALAGRTIRCILFDLGDTLWSRKDFAIWHKMENDANMRAAALLRTYVPPAFLPPMDDRTLGMYLHEATDEQMRTSIRHNPEIEPDGGLAVVKVLQQWGIADVDSLAGSAIFEGFRVRIPGSRPLYDDVLSTLHELSQRGFLLGVVTNRHWGGELFQEDLRTLGLLNYFDSQHMAISVDLGIRKPNPAIFMHALHSLNVPPEQAVMVGDSLRSDVLGAKLLGVFTIWKPKPSVLQEIYSHKNAARSQHEPSSPAVATAGERPADLPAGMHITDDDYVLAQVQSRTGNWNEQMQRDIQPDLVIETLSDLLDIFLKVGQQ